jgi:hypothetical protein
MAGVVQRPHILPHSAISRVMGLYGQFTILAYARAIHCCAVPPQGQSRWAEAPDATHRRLFCLLAPRPEGLLTTSLYDGLMPQVERLRPTMLRRCDPGLIRFYDYWELLRGDRSMPARRDLDPLQAPRGFLPNIMLIDYLHDQRRYRYRLVGSNIITATGENRTGRYFDEFGFFRDHPAVLPQYARVVQSRRPLYSLEPFTNFISESDYDVDRLILPLSDDDHFVDTLLVLFQFNSGPFAARLPADLVRTMFHQDGR